MCMVNRLYIDCGGPGAATVSQNEKGTIVTVRLTAEARMPEKQELLPHQLGAVGKV